MVIFILLALLFTTAFILYSKWQFIDDRGGVEGKWHPYGLIMRALVIFLPILVNDISLQDVFLSGMLCVIWWDIGINIIALNQKWWYVGTTAKWDKLFNKRTKWILYGTLLISSILLKILTNPIVI